MKLNLDMQREGLLLYRRGNNNINKYKSIKHNICRDSTQETSIESLKTLHHLGSINKISYLIHQQVHRNISKIIKRHLYNKQDLLNICPLKQELHNKLK